MGVTTGRCSRTHSSGLGLVSGQGEPSCTSPSTPRGRASTRRGRPRAAAAPPPLTDPTATLPGLFTIPERPGRTRSCPTPACPPPSAWPPWPHRRVRRRPAARSCRVTGYPSGGGGDRTARAGDPSTAASSLVTTGVTACKARFSLIVQVQSPTAPVHTGHRRRTAMHRPARHAPRTVTIGPAPFAAEPQNRTMPDEPGSDLIAPQPGSGTPWPCSAAASSGRGLSGEVGEPGVVQLVRDGAGGGRAVSCLAMIRSASPAVPTESTDVPSGSRPGLVRERRHPGRSDVQRHRRSAPPGTVFPRRPRAGTARRAVVRTGKGNNGRELQRVLREMQGQT